MLGFTETLDVVTRRTHIYPISTESRESAPPTKHPEKKPSVRVQREAIAAGGHPNSMNSNEENE